MKRILGVSLNANGTLLAVGDYPSLVRLYDCDSKRLKWQFKGPSPEGSYQVTFSPTSEWLLCWGSTHGRTRVDPTTRLFDGLSGRQLFTWDWSGPDGRPVEDLAWSPDGGSIVRGALDKLQSYSPLTGKKVAQIRLGGEVIHVNSHSKGVKVRHYADGGAHCVEAVYATPGLARLSLRPEFDSDSPQHPEGGLAWRRQNRNLVVTGPSGEVLYQGDAEARLLYWTHGGFVVDESEGVRCISRTGQVLGQLPRVVHRMGSTDLALEGVGYGGPCRVYDLSTGKQIGQFAYAAGISSSPDDRRVAVCTRSGLLILDIQESLRAQTLVLCK